MFDQHVEYEALKELARKEVNLVEEFEKDGRRAEKFTCKLDLGNGDFMHYDYSKNLITAETKELLVKLAGASKVEEWRERMFRGEHINGTEDRAVLHVALRERKRPEVVEELEKMARLAEQIRSGEWKGQFGDAIEDVVNLGIGGSDLGPAMAVQALSDLSNAVRVHFVSNVDDVHLQRTLQQCHPATTLFLIVSKTFTTRETMLNAHSARLWLQNHAITQMDRHFIAVSTNQKAVEEFGAKECVRFWDWVGGRYSLWSAVGLSIMISVGSEAFLELLEGGRRMDEHFRQAPLEQNLPVLAALLGVWYRNFLDAPSYAVIPYEQALSRLPAYLQQLDMESNGKRATKNHATNKEATKNGLVNYKTGPLVWGEPGTNGQHAFFQHLHQGSDLVPLDFLIGLHPPTPSRSETGEEHHLVLFANCLAQSEALMLGSPNATDPNRHFSGNRPSTTLVYNRLTPRTLGALIALYEHKVFVQGVLWNINSFDQFGVELGKKLATKIEKELLEGSGGANHDSSTSNLIQLYLSKQ